MKTKEKQTQTPDQIQTALAAIAQGEFKDEDAVRANRLRAAIAKTEGR